MSQKVTGDTLIAPATDVYLNEWIEGVRARSKPATFERYNSSVKLFLASLGEKSKKPISSITSRDVETFLNSRLAAKVAPKTAIVDLKIINIVFRKADKFGDIDKKPVAAVRLPRMSVRNGKYLPRMKSKNWFAPRQPMNGRRSFCSATFAARV